jgi:SAM-dependent methyltransferase
MRANNIEQQIQEEDYSFPYHYVPQYFPSFTTSYSWHWGLYYISALDFVLKKVVAYAPRSILDVGTGDGRFVRELSRALEGVRICGIDYSERAISLAKALNPQLAFACVDVTSNPPNEKFALLTLIEVFEHIPIDLAPRFAASLANLLEEDGRLVVTVPHSNVPVSVKHFRHFSAESLRRCFYVDFEMEECIFLDKRSVWVRLMTRLIHNEYFALRHWGVMNRLYRAYKKLFLVTSEANCGRIYASFKRRRPSD